MCAKKAVAENARRLPFAHFNTLSSNQVCDIYAGSMKEGRRERYGYNRQGKGGGGGSAKTKVSFRFARFVNKIQRSDRCKIAVKVDGFRLLTQHLFCYC